MAKRRASVHLSERKVLQREPSYTLECRPTAGLFIAQNLRLFVRIQAVGAAVRTGGENGVYWVLEFGNTP